MIELLGLEPLPGEGGQWAQTWRDEHSSAIYFLLRPNDFSALHRLGGTELWHHYAGAPVEMLLLEPGGTVLRPRLGDTLGAGEWPVVTVKPGRWMAAGTTGDWSLVGTTMAPPFEEAGFELGDRTLLSAEYPEAAEDIARFTRDPPTAGIGTATANASRGRVLEMAEQDNLPPQDELTRQDVASPDELIRLDRRVIVVTGAGGGIGTGIARRLMAAGATVVAHSRSSPTGHLVDADGHPVASVQADLAEPDAPQRVVDAALERHGRIDGLVNNAAVQPLVHFAVLSDAEWAEMIDVNLTAVHRLTHAAAAAMRAQGSGGSIVHIASIEAHHPTDLHGHYATAKAGLVMHARAAAGAYGPNGIRVNSISPGLIDRPGLADDWPEGVARWHAAAPLGRLGTAADVGDACVFLCSDLARWITGVDLAVDGGVLTRPTW